MMCNPKSIRVEVGFCEVSQTSYNTVSGHLPDCRQPALNPERSGRFGSMAPKPETQFVRACSTGKPEVVRDLLQGRISPETRDTYGLTGLIWAGRKGQVGVAEVLLAGGADLEAKDLTGRTALHHAVAFKRPDFVGFIANHGAFLNPVDMHGCTPLDLATMAGDTMVALLEQLGAQRRKSEKRPERGRASIDSLQAELSEAPISRLKSGAFTFN